MQFQYRARDRSGKLVEGQVEALGQAEALTMLGDQGLFVTSVKAAGAAIGSRKERSGAGSSTQSSGGGATLSLGKKKPTATELAIFCAQGGSLVASGVTVLQMLRVMGRQVKGRRLGTILSDVALAVEGGSTLGEAFFRFRDELPNSMLQIIRVAEIAGNLDEGLAMLGKYYEQEDSFQRKVKSATQYPKIVLFVTFGVMIFMLTGVLPRFAEMFLSLGDKKLPAITLFVMGLSDFLVHRWYIWVPLLLGVYYGTGYLLRTNQAVRLVWHRTMLRLPIAGELTFNRELGRFSRTLGTLLRSGVPIVQALGVTQNTLENLAMRQVIVEAAKQVEVGEGLVNTLRQSSLFPPALVEMMAVGEVTGNVEAALFKVGDYCEKDVSSRLERLGSMLEPILVVVLGVVILGVLIPVLLPMFSIYQQIR